MTNIYIYEKNRLVGFYCTDVSVRGEDCKHSMQYAAVQYGSNIDKKNTKGGLYEYA